MAKPKKWIIKEIISKTINETELNATYNKVTNSHTTVS